MELLKNIPQTGFQSQKCENPHLCSLNLKARFFPFNEFISGVIRSIEKEEEATLKSTPYWKCYLELLGV